MSSLADSVVELPVAIRREDVLAFLGYPKGRAPGARIEQMLEDVLPEARAIVRARGAFVELEAARAADVGLSPIDASGFAIGLCTAGPELEARARELLARGEPTRALLFDAAGSAAVEEAADRVGALVGGAAEPGATEPDAVSTIECRLSPGYGRWPLQAQQALFALLPHEAVGVELLPSLMMTPCKSISFAMWLGAVDRPAEGLAGCARCGLPRCQYRRAPRTEESP